MMTVLEVVNLFNVDSFIYHSSAFTYDVNVEDAHHTLLNRKHVSYYFDNDDKLNIIETA